MSYTDALARISQIGSEVSGLRGAFTPSPPSAAPTASAGAGATPGTASGSGTFSTALAGALAGAGSPLASAIGGASPLSSAIGPLPQAGGVVTGTGLPYGYSGAQGAGAGLPASASTMLTTGQQQFASRLAADTGLDPGVVTAWLLAEENGGAAVSRQSAGNNDWLNIGYTDAGTYGAADSVWSDPVAAADATAGWLRGQSTIPGYGTASSGIQAIMQTVGQGPASQIAAIQGSGWASGGYPELGTLYQQVAA